MANDSDYTITTLSNNLNQRNKPVFSQAGNNTITLRDKCSPYTLVASPEGDINRSIVKFPFGCVTASSVASCVTTLNVPSAEYATLPLAVAAIPTGVPLTCSYVINLSGSTTYFHNNLPLINVDATEDFFVTLQAWEGTIDGGKPIIDGSGAAFYIFDVANVDYTVIDGIHFKTWSSSQSGLVWGGNSSQVISGTVKNCTIDATNGGKYGL